MNFDRAASTFLCLCAMTLQASAHSPPVQPKPKPPAVPEKLAAIETRYRKAGTMMARFTQIAESTLTRVKTQTSGVISIKRPDKIRWETQNPEPNLMVSDGKKFWYYTPPFDSGEKGQAILRKTAQTQSRFASVLLTGAFSKLKNLTIKADPKNPDAYILIPRKGSAGTVREARVVLSRGTSGSGPEPRPEPWIETIVLEHEGGNRTEIRLSQVQVGPKLEDAMFTFDPPAGTDIVTE